MRNPFRIRASQRSVSDDDFVRLFSAGALDMLQSIKDPWDGLIFLRSAPGGGKTTFLRLMTPRPLRLTHQLADNNQQVRASRDVLRESGAIGSSGPRLLGAMVVFTTEYRELSEFDRGNALFRELLNSRIVVATLRSVLERSEKQFPNDLDQIRFEWQADSGATIPAKANGRELFDWASKIETNFYSRMDELGTAPDVQDGHARLDALKWFALAGIYDAEGRLDVKRVLLLDELQTLSASQRTSLIEYISNARQQCGVWIAERLEALTHRDLLSEGALADRDYENVIQVEKRWSGARAKPYGRFVESIANLRAAKADGFEGRDFFPMLSETDDASTLDPLLKSKIAAVKNEITGSNWTSDRYRIWLKAAEEAEGSLLDQAIRWRSTQVLIERDRRKTQKSFDFDALTVSDLEKRSAAEVDRAAEHFLRTEIGAPMYFGRDVISSVSSFNVDQYLEITGTLFEEVSAKFRFLRDQPVPLSAARQDALIRDVAKNRWEGLVRRLPRGLEARRLLEAIGKYCIDQTFRPTAPYAPGVTGIALTMSDRATLIDSPDDKVKAFINLREVLTSLVAHNLLVPKLDHQQGNKAHVVFYLNRLLCVHFNLPLGYGGWRSKSLKELQRWQEKGVSAVSPEQETIFA